MMKNNPFDTARIQLTAWYVLIIFVISGLFSVAFYQSATLEIDRIIERLKFEELRGEIELFRVLRQPNAPTLEDLQQHKERAMVSLIAANGAILIVTAGLGYWLAGRTLKPIKAMVEDQNRFISDASHELRTPIATLRAEMEGALMEKKITDSSARKLVNSNLEELSRLQNLTNNLLSLTGLGLGKNYKEKKENINVVEIVEVAKSRVNALAKAKSIKITTKISSEKLKVSGNKENLTELITILIENAIKYSPNNSGVTVGVKKLSKKIEIIVRDQGMGIAKNEQEKIFERFYRTDKSRSTTEGFGLGLSIAKKVIEDHSGTIEVNSTSGKGSTFTVTLPENNS